MDGYDIGGAEYPLDPEFLTIIDREDPAKVGPPVRDYGNNVSYDWIQADLDKPGWHANLKSRPVIYMGRVLRHTDKNRLHRLAEEVYQIWKPGGILTIFDAMQFIEPFIESIMCQNEAGDIEGDVEVKELELINPSNNADGKWYADWRVVLYRRPPRPTNR